MSNIMPVLAEYAELKEAAKEIAAQLKEIEGQVKAHMIEHSTVETPQHVITAQPVKGRTTLDRKAVEQFIETNGGRIDDFTNTGAPSLRITVTSRA